MIERDSVSVWYVSVATGSTYFDEKLKKVKKRGNFEFYLTVDMMTRTQGQQQFENK